MSNLQPSFEQENGSILIPMKTIPPTNVAKGNCWESNFSDEFPISYIQRKGDEATIIVGPPHLDYKIITHLKNRKMDGESTLLSDKNVLVANLTFVDGIANGPCTIYDEWGSLYFEGRFVNGYRQGRGKEYEKKKVVHEGLYEKGKKLVKMTEMDGYWKEYDNSKNLLSVYKKDDEGNNMGVCFFYENGEISRLSEWHEGKESLYNGYFKLFDETNRKWIEGEYRDGVRNGESREYDENGGMLFEGYYENGKQLNMVRLDEMDGYWKEYEENGYMKSICKKDRYGRYEGICYFYENGAVTKISEWKEGREYPFLGYFKFYDANHSQWMDGFYSDGRILHFSPMAEMTGFWKEYDDNGNLIHICEIDGKGNYNGMCYNFENGVLQDICRWEEGGRKVPYNGYYKVYNVAQNQWMEGNYENDKKCDSPQVVIKDEYCREYDESGNIKSICKKDKYGRYEGICYFYENGAVTKISEWKEGIEISLSGKCNFFDEPHKVWYEGGFSNGLREGKCREYDINRNIIFEGFYKHGNKLIPLNNMKGYWEERDNQNRIVRICQIDANGRYDGLCYQYRENQIIRVSRWREDREIEILKEFNNGIMTEYKNNKKIYSGGYIPNLKSNYQRQGEGEEYELDGETLLYKGSFINGKRDGHGRLFKHARVNYNGEWKKGMKKQNYILYLVLSLVFMFLTSAVSYMLFNAYIGVITSGICITAICFYINKYAGLIASGLFVVMCCFFASTYAGISASIVFVIIVSFCLNVYAGFVPTGLVIAAICMYMNTYLGIYAFGLFLMYVIFLIVHCCGWKKSIVYSSTFYILSLCTIITLVLVYDKNDMVKYVVVYAIGFLLILILWLIIGCKKEKVNPLISSAMIILVSCTIISLLIQTVQPSYTKYIVISLVGFLLICIVNLIVFECGWNTTIVLKSAVVIVVSCIIFSTVIGSLSVPALQYATVFASGLLLIIIVSFFTGYQRENIHILLSSSGLIMSCCVLICFLLSSMKLSFLKYYLVVLIGLILFFLIYLLVSLFRENMIIALVSLGIILILCVFTDMIMAAIDFYIFRHILVYFIGILLIIFISLITPCNKENIHLLISSSGLIVCICILTSFLLSSLTLASVKYYFVFLIGMILFFLIYLIVSICKEDMGIVIASLIVISIICGVIDMIMAAIEIAVIRQTSVIVIGVLLALLVSYLTGCKVENIHILISSYGLIIFAGILTSLLFSDISLLSVIYYSVFLIGVVLFFLVYFFVSIFRGNMVVVFKIFCTDMAVCGIIDLLMASFEKYIVAYVTVIFVGLILFFLLLVFTECGNKNKHALFSGTGLLFSLVYLICWLLGYRGIIFIDYFLVFAVWMLLFFSVYFYFSVIEGDMAIVLAWFFLSGMLGIAGELIVASIDFLWIRVFTIYLFGGLITWLLISDPDKKYNLCIKILGAFMGIFISSVVCMLLGASENPVVQLLLLISGITSVPILIVYLFMLLCLIVGSLFL